MGVDWRHLLSRHLRGRTVLVAVGDRYAGDDAAGPALVDALQGKTDLTLLDVGSYPQNYMGVVAREAPETVILVDGAELGLQPGEIRLLCGSELVDMGGGSHGFPMTALLEQLAVLSNAEILLLGIQIETLERGSSLSSPVEQAVDEIVRFITSLRPEAGFFGDEHDVEKTRPDTR